MNTFLQIAIGLAPIEVFLLMFAFLKKKPRIPQLVIAGIVGCCIITSVVLSFQSDKPTEEAVTRQKEAVQQLDVIYTVANQNGGTVYARQMLTQLREDAADSSKITMCDAVLNAAQGDWRAARVLYNKAVAMGEPENQEFAKACDDAMAYAVQLSAGNLPAENSPINQLKTVALGEIAKRSSGAGSEEGQIASLLLDSNALFDSYLSTNELDKSEAKELSLSVSKLVQANDSLLRIREVRECRTKLLALNGNYSAIAGNVDENATYSELAIAAELYLNGLVKDSDFQEDYVDGYKEMASAVSAQLREVQKNAENTEAAEKVTALIEKLTAADPTALEILQDAISGVASDEKNTDKPKAHIQLAKIAHHHKDNAQAKNEISAALSSVGVSRDEEFYTPLQKLAGVVNDKDNSAELKNVSGYVEEVLDNTSDPIVIAVIDDIRTHQDEEPEETVPPATEPEETEPENELGGTMIPESSENKEEQREEVPLVPETNDQSEGDSFATFMGDTVNQLRVSVNITNVDASAFSKVVATVNIDGDLAATAEELKAMIKVNDCGVDIEDFTVEKVDVAAVHILLCCDVSGSMDGQPIKDLKNAVKLFVETASDKESLALVTFSSGVEAVHGFGTENQTLIEKAEGLHAIGGTNMYDAVIESIGKFPGNDSGLKYILLLSDGDDNTPRTENEISTNIGFPAMDNGIVLYSLGVGSAVNLQYMETLAGVTGGEYLHVQDSSSLQAFYDGLRNQMLNQYIITYEAKDTLRTDRVLKISMTQDAVSQDTAYYSLQAAGEDEMYREDSIISVGNKGVSHLDTSVIMKSPRQTKVKIFGFGFAKDDTFSVELDGAVDYDSSKIACAYIDENTLEMTIPGGLACGKYDVKVAIGNLSTTFVNGITIVTPGSEKLTEVGPYKFTSYEKVEANGVTTLSGSVTLNGWLTFTGDVTLRTSGSDAREVVMTDNNGSYITFREDMATGLAGMLAKAKKRFPVPALGEVVLVNELAVSPDDDAYPVNKVPVPGFHINGVAGIETPGVSLYPNKLTVASDAFTTELPMQDKLLGAAGLDLYSFDVAIGGSINNQSIDIKAEVEYERDDDAPYKSVNLGAAPIYVSPANFKVLIDTAANEYSIDFDVKIGFIESDGLGLYLKWSARDNDKGAQFLVPSEVLLKADFDINAQIGPVPVTYSDFKLGLSDIDPNENILKWKLKGAFDLSTGKLSDLIPGLEEIFEDPAMLMLDDTTVELSLGQAYFGIETTMKLLESVELAHAKIEAGKISVNSVVLGFDDEASIGMRGEVGIGLKWEIPNCSVDIGADCALHLHNRFLGIEVEGNANVEIGWWIFKAKVNEYASLGLGFQRVDDMPTFVLKILTSDAGGYEGYFLIWNEESHLKSGKLEV